MKPYHFFCCESEGKNYGRASSWFLAIYLFTIADVILRAPPWLHNAIYSRPTIQQAPLQLLLLLATQNMEESCRLLLLLQKSIKH